MAEYQNTIITNAGISVLNRVLASKATMTFTRAVSSTADLSGKTEADLRNMTSLSNIMQNGICSSYDVHNQNMVSLDLVFTNEGLGNSYMINTVGLYAKASDSSTEILYAIARAGVDSNGNSLAEQMPAYVDSKLTKFTISLFTQVGQASSVAVSITDEGVVKSINSLTPDESGNVVVDTSSHAKAIQEQLNSGKLYIPVLDDSGNPLTDESGNVLLNTQYLPKTISINGGQKVEADSANNIDLQTYTKQAINNWMETKADQTDADLAHRALQAQIDANLAKETADKADTDAHLKADEPIIKEADSRARLNQASMVTDTFTIPLLDSDGRALTDEAGNVLTTQKHAVWSINGVEAPDNGDFRLDYFTKQEINNKLDSIKLMIDQLRSTDDANLTAAMNNFYQKADIDSKLSTKLDASKAGTPTVITTPVDLNTLTTCGSYFIQNDLGTTTNTPIPNAWLFVRVEGVPNRLTQTVWKDIDPVNQWVRVFTGSWGNWTQITKAI